MKLPNGWTNTKLRDVGKCITGLTYSPDDVVDEHHGMLVLRSSNVQNGILAFNDNVFVSAKVEGDALTRENDILVCVRNGSRGLIGKSALIRGTGAGVAHGAFMMVFRTSDAAFFYQMFQSREYYRQVHENLGATINSINSSDFYKFKFLLPPKDERAKIADLLTSWDSAIEKIEQLIAAKLNHFKATEHQLLTARIRINGFSSQWKLLRADKIFDSVSLKGFGSEPLLSVTQDKGVIPRDMLTGRVTMPSGDTKSFKLMEPGNFVISLRSFQGGLEYSAYRGLVSPAYTVLKATREIDERFFRIYFRSADFIKRLSVAVIGIRDGKQVSYQDFCSIKIPFPPLEEQQAISAMLDQSEREITLLRNQADALKKQKRGLMQKLLTGQWRVPAESNKVAA